MCQEDGYEANCNGVVIIYSDFELVDGKSPSHRAGKTADLPIYPTTPMEILLLAILCCISVAVIAYMMVVLYRLRTVSTLTS